MSPTAPVLPPIGELNRLAGSDFRRALLPLVEAAEPLAAALEADRPYASYTALLDRAEAIVERLPELEQAQVLNAHPRIGEDTRRMSALSYREQGYERENGQALGDVYRELAPLNHAYEERFGFRFVVFVNGRPKSAILPLVRERLQGSRQAELTTGRREMLLIARDRLRTLQPVG